MFHGTDILPIVLLLLLFNCFDIKLLFLLSFLLNVILFFFLVQLFNLFMYSQESIVNFFFEYVIIYSSSFLLLSFFFYSFKKSLHLVLIFLWSLNCTLISFFQIVKLFSILFLSEIFKHVTIFFLVFINPIVIWLIVSLLFF